MFPNQVVAGHNQVPAGKGSITANQAGLAWEGKGAHGQAAGGQLSALHVADLLLSHLAPLKPPGPAQPARKAPQPG